MQHQAESHNNSVHQPMKTPAIQMLMKVISRDTNCCLENNLRSDESVFVFIRVAVGPDWLVVKDQVISLYSHQQQEATENQP